MYIVNSLLDNHANNAIPLDSNNAFSINKSFFLSHLGENIGYIRSCHFFRQGTRPKSTQESLQDMHNEYENRR